MIEAKTKKLLRKLGNYFVPTGLILMIGGSALQVFIYLASGGTDMTRQPRLLVWGGIFATIGIIMLVAGFAMRMTGSFKKEDGAEK